MTVKTKRLLVVCALVVALLSLAGVSTSGASAASAWWHLSSGARPTYLHAGLAREDVQEIVATTETFEGHPEIAAFSLNAKAGKNAQAEPAKPVGFFVSEPVAGELGEPFLPLTAASVKSALESTYGPGQGPIEVSERKEGTSLVLTIKTAGPAAPLEVGGLGIGEPTAKVVSEGRADGEIIVSAENLGDGSISGEAKLGELTPTTLSDILPHGLRAVAFGGSKPQRGTAERRESIPCSLSTLSCKLAGGLEPYEAIELRIAVVVEGAVTGENEASVSGGGAPAASIHRPVTINSAPTPFGVEDYELTPEAEGGAPVTQAGAHPFQLTTSIALNQDANAAPVQSPRSEVEVAGLPKNVDFQWPAGLIGDPSAIPRCTLGQFLQDISGLYNECTPQTAVGVATVTVFEPTSFGTLVLTTPLFNLDPAVGEPARFGFFVPTAQVPVVIDTSIRTGGDYGVTVKVHDITQTAAFLSSEVTVWGVPGDPRHDSARGWGCIFEPRGIEPRPPCQAQNEQHAPPFLTLPVSCATSLQTSVEATSWADSGNPQTTAGSGLSALNGCNQLPFSSEIKVAPDGRQASTPSGLSVDVHVPQEANLNGAGVAASDVKEIAVTLPQGVSLNPAGADGLEACSEGLIGYLPGESTPPEDLHFTPKLPGSNGSSEPFEQGKNFCPDASKVGTVEIATPLLPPGQHLKGSVYLASQNANPFGSLIAMYIVAEDPVSGALVKLPGEVILDQATGQISATFKNTPQLAFEDAELHFFGGDRAPLATPAHCGTYTTNATFTPWSGTQPVTSQSSFQITTGPNGTACPGTALPFSPSLTAGTVNNQAGSFSPLTVTMSREDGQQNLKSVQLHMPAGLSGVLTGVPLCGEAQADAGTCSGASLIGETTVSVGLGGDPYSVKGGQVFLTGPYEGAPFGLSIVNPAVAGPFNLGKVVVRTKLEVDPHTAAVTVTSDESGPYAIPPSIDGIPLQIKHVNVTISRPGFMFNPTNCTPAVVTGTLDSIEGASSSLSVPFQATNCAVLKFAPKFAVTTSGKTSKAKGASLNVKLTYPKALFGTQANIARVKVDLPKALPSRLTTLQKACTNAQFEANPAGCPAASIIGHAKATTPLIPVPLEGPAYFVSHGGEAFPSLIMVLQGYGVTLDLVGTTFISKAGITSSTFKTVPDAPVGSFELNLPEGKFSALAANGNLCKTKLAMPTEFLAQNGAKINQSTKITATGCPKQKKAKAKHKAKHKSPRKG
jgi:hypothetical protein